MAINHIQFQNGLSLPEFLAHFGTERQCEDALEKSRWPQGFHCPRCDNTEHYLLKVDTHKTFQCQRCRLQTSLIAGTLFQSTRLKLTVWFLAIYLISQAKTGLSALALKRHLGVSYHTAWLLQHKLMQAMVEREEQYTLCGDVQVDDAYLGGARGWKSRTRVREQSAIRCRHILGAEGHPMYVKMAPVPGFTLKAIAEWAKVDLSPGCAVVSDGLACFAGLAMRIANIALSLPAVASPILYQNSNGLILSWEISKQVWAVPTMHSISQSMARIIWEHSCIASIDDFI